MSFKKKYIPKPVKSRHIKKKGKLLFVKIFNKKKGRIQRKLIRLFFFQNFKIIYEYKWKECIQGALFLQPYFLKKVTIKFVQNNIFCTLSDLKRKKTLHTSSAGIYKIKISKRKLKHFYVKYINYFFKKIIKNVNNLNFTIFNVSVPKYLRKKIGFLILKFINYISVKRRFKLFTKKNKKIKHKKSKVIEKKNKKISIKTRPKKKNTPPIKGPNKIKKKNIVIFFDPKKCFNGCRAKKKVRKKRRLYRIFKKN